jgi:hypothetical protein
LEILSADSELLTRARSLTVELLPCLQTDGKIALTEAQYLRIFELLKSIQKESSPSLQKTIAFVLEKLESDNFLKEMNLKIEKN